MKRRMGSSSYQGPAAQRRRPPGWNSIWDAEIEPVNYSLAEMYARAFAPPQSQPGDGEHSLASQAPDIKIEADDHSLAGMHARAGARPQRPPGGGENTHAVDAAEYNETEKLEAHMHQMFPETGVNIVPQDSMDSMATPTRTSDFLFRADNGPGAVNLQGNIGPDL